MGPHEQRAEQQQSIWRLTGRRGDAQPPESGHEAPIRRDDPNATDAPPARPEPSSFPLSVTTLVGQSLRLMYTPTSRTFIGAFAATLESRGGQPLAWLGLYGPGELVGMVCREGSWSLNKRRRYGWELLIESGDGHPVGWYSGRHWFPGGTIILTDGTCLDLRRSRRLGWKLQVSDTREVVAEFSNHTSASTSLAIRSLPPEIYSNAPVVIVTACAVLMLTALAIPVQTVSGSG